MDRNSIAALGGADRPPVSGSRIAVWSQSLLSSEAVGTVFVGSKVLSGPRDEDIHVMGLDRPVEPNADNDFLPLDDEGRANDVPAFDAVHTFAVVRQVLTMYRRAVTRFGGEEHARIVVDWYWNKTDDGGGVDRDDREPLAVYPRFGPGTGGCYSRTQKQLEFEYFDPSLARGRSGTEGRESRTVPREQIFVCRAFDVVAHETGHAILDGLRKGKRDPLSYESLALHEAFADLTVVFSSLSQLSRCEALIIESKGALLEPNAVNVIGRTLGSFLHKRRRGVRSLTDPVAFEDAGEDPHYLSQSFASAIYRCIARVYTLCQQREWHEPGETLLRVSRHMMELVLATACHASALRFKDVCATLRALHDQHLANHQEIALIGEDLACKEIVAEELAELESRRLSSSIVADHRLTAQRT